jgi:hypothetical protein
MLFNAMQLPRFAKCFQTPSNKLGHGLFHTLQVKISTGCDLDGGQGAWRLRGTLSQGSCMAPGRDAVRVRPGLVKAYPSKSAGSVNSIIQLVHSA